MLIKAGANASAVDINGRTALRYDAMLKQGSSCIEPDPAVESLIKNAIRDQMAAEVVAKRSLPLPLDVLDIIFRYVGADPKVVAHQRQLEASASVGGATAGGATAGGASAGGATAGGASAKQV